MTISRTLRKRLRRYALFCLMAATSTGVAIRATNGQASDTHDSIPNYCSQDYCCEVFDEDYTDDLCGWTDAVDDSAPKSDTRTESDQNFVAAPAPFLAVDVSDELDVDTCNYDAWLTGTLNVASPQHSESVATEPTPEKPTPEFNATLATIAAAATAANPIRISHWTEPFAMVGPAGSNSPRELRAFQAWFDAGKHMFDEFVPVVDFDGHVESHANRIVECTPHRNPVHHLVGGSPFIATLEETYTPYDLDPRDVPQESSAEVAGGEPNEQSPSPSQVVWNDGLFSPAHQPFCVRSLAVMRVPGWSPLIKSVPEAAKTSPPAPPSTIAIDDRSVADPSVADHSIVGSADCLLDELIWKVSVELEDREVTDRWLRPGEFGKQLASLVVNGDQLASHMASGLAQVWPAAQPAKPIPGIGAKLLARAEAAEQLPAKGLAKPLTQEQLARAGAKFWQWVTVARTAMDDVADRLIDVTEIARNRGIQDESQRR